MDDNKPKRIFLKIWLIKNCIREKDFAKTIGLSRVHLSNAINGKANFSRKVGKKICEQTGFAYELVMEGEK